MLSIDQIKNQYPDNMHKFGRGIIREYLQYLILEIIFNTEISNKLSFLGGTCLRIVYGSQRFSEDLDFDNKKLSSQEFTSLAGTIEKELKRQGFDIETSIIQKNAIHCNIKFSNILYANQLTGIRNEKIDIHIDTFDQGYNYEPQLFILNKFNVFKQIRVTPKSTILSQKLWTITQRNRAKGRDYYDIIQLLQDTRPDINFLKLKFTSSNIKDEILTKIKDVDLKAVARDIEPFLVNKKESEKILLFKEYMDQLDL